MLLEIKTARPDLISHQFRTLVLKCDACGSTFFHAYKKTYAEKQRHFCCKKCAGIAKRVNVDVSRVRQMICVVCQKTFERTCNTNQSDPRTCSRSCASSLRSRESNLVSYMQTSDVRARAMKTRSAHWLDGSVVHGMKGKHFPCSRETKEILREKNSGENHPFFGKHHTEIARQKMRDARSQLITAGKMNWAIFGHKAGVYVSQKIGKSVYFRSSWEEATMRWLDANIDVVTWDYECIRIPYRYDHHKRWYIPDFVVTFQDGHQEMWEIKPKEFIGAEKIRMKTEAAQEYCQRESISSYVILSRDELQQRGILHEKRT